MPDHHSPDVPPFDMGETLTGITGLPAQLPGDPRRQAVFSIQGTVYQAWWSIDAWLQLTNADEVIYLEGAEDFDVVRSDERYHCANQKERRFYLVGQCQGS